MLLSVKEGCKGTKSYF